MNENTVAVTQPNQPQTGNFLPVPDEAQLIHDLGAIHRFQQLVQRSLIQDHDFGVIPGTQKPTLLKPGAEKITKLLGLSDTYEILDRQEDWQKGFFRYLVKAKLTSVNTGILISEGLGECNSLEGKYRWRESKRKCPECGAEAIIKGKAEYGGGWLCFKKQGGCGAKFPEGDQSIEGQVIGRVENEDIYSQVNTILKMAKKRALIDAALSAGRLSDLFTQDLEDLQANGVPVGSGATRRVDTTGEIIEQKTTRSASAEQDWEKMAREPELTKQPAYDAGKIMIDTDDLKKKLDLLDWKAALKYLCTTYQIEAKSIREALSKMTPEQQAEFQKEVDDRLSMKG